MTPKSLVDRVRAHTSKQEYEAALEVLIDAWRATRAPALANAIDAVDALDTVAPEPPKTADWLAAAKKAKTYRARGALLRTACKRPANDITKALAAVVKWDDPRLTTHIVALLAELPFSGTRTRDVWRNVFAAAKVVKDPRFLVVATTLPSTWNVGAETKGFLTNRLAEVTKGLEVPALPAPLEKALVALVEELGKARPSPAANEVALLDAIYANPDDDAPRLIYADWLQECGDPRGEFIVMQFASKRDLAAERELIKKHKKAWLGPLATILGGELEFRRGFPARGAAKFRHQRDTEQYGHLREWATVEELEFGLGGTRADQERWTRFVHPSMTALRKVAYPALEHVLGGSRPWRIEDLVLRSDDVENRAAFHQLCTSPLLPKLRHLTLHGTSRPEWLDGLTNCPPHLAVHEKLASAACMKWLENAKRTKLETLTILDEYRFTRDQRGAFTRLDVVIREGYTKIEDLPAWLVEHIVKSIRKLPAGSLSQLDARVELRGTLVPLPAIVKAGKKALGG